MEYKVNRFEKVLNHEGEVTGMFLAVNVFDGEEGYTQEKWLNSDEITAVLVDETAIQPIIEKCAAEGELYLENWKATKPMPPINVLEEVGKREEIEAMIKVENISSHKVAITEAKAQALEDSKPVEILSEEIITP